MPYLFEGPDGERLERAFPPAKTLRAFARDAESAAAASSSASSAALSHFEYFRLCLSAHYLTCGTPVPTDVDNQIRRKLWPEKLPTDVALAMADLVLESRAWDFTLVSTRFVRGPAGTPWEGEVLSGHFGEWFTVAAGAYGGLRQYASPAIEAKRAELAAAIAAETNRHAEIFGALWRAKDGVGCLKASASIAHNFGDLDRVMDMWELSPGDPLRLAYYKLGALPFDTDRNLRYLGRLWVAGELYKSKIDGGSMALENHRHFALRKPRALRGSPELVVPTAPFFDAWGEEIARRLATPEGAPAPEMLEVVDALSEGWDRQPGTIAYGRALRAILEIHPKLREDDAIRARMANPAQRRVLETSREVFEKRWGEEALRHMDDIPSRAT